MTKRRAVMEHRGVSPDSSTHISEKSRKSKKRKHKQKSKSKHKKVKSSSSESNHTSHKKSKKLKRTSPSPTHSDESNEEIFDIKPLSGYVDDRKELHKEIFSIVSKKEVKDLLPPSLKRLKFKEFKSLCLEQLEVMSQKRIRHIIAGQEMVSSSSDESEAQEQQKHVYNQVREDESMADPVNIPLANEQQQKDIDNQVGEDESMNDPVNIPLVNEQEQANTITRQVEIEQPSKVSILEEMSLSPNQDEIDELIEPAPQTSQEPIQHLEEEDEEKGSPTQTDEQSLVMAEAELKELEFRARALKSLVIARERQQKVEKEKEAKNNIK